MAVRIEIRSDTSANWASSGTVAAANELVYATDTLDLRIGDGVNTFTNLKSVNANAQTAATNAANSASAAAASAQQAAAPTDGQVSTLVQQSGSQTQTALDGRYGRRTELVRMTAAKLPTWTRKRQLALLNHSPARILCVGDSTTAGVYSDSYTTATGSTNQGGPNAYPAQLARILNSRGIPAAIGMAIPGHSGNDDSRWSGTINYAGSNVGAGANAGYIMTGTGTLTLAPNVKADTYIVYYYGDSGTGAMSGTATGGTATAINTANATAGIHTATVTAPTPSAANTLALAWTSGTVFVLGVEFYDSTNPNVVRILPAGVGGSQAYQWANASSSTTFGGQAFINAVAPDLAIISLGINDGAAGRTASQIMADVTTLANDVATSGDILLMSAIPHNGPGILDSVNAAFLASAYPYVDLQLRYGYNMEAWGLQTTDSTHPNALGYGDIAAIVGKALVP